MRFITYVNEGKKTSIKLPTNDQERYSHFAGHLKRCKPYIKKAGGELLFRGAAINEDMIEIKPRKTREPRDMKPEYHKVLDKLFKKKYGWKPRSEGVFCTGDSHQAGVYGQIYSMWPIGAFKFIWSAVITDLFIHIKKMEDDVMRKASKFENLDETEIAKQLMPEFQKTVNTYKSTNMSLAIDNEHEVTILCSSYFLIHNHYTRELRAITKNGELDAYAYQ